MTNQHWHEILRICTPVWNHNLFCGHERFTLLSILKSHTLLSYQNSKHKMVHCSNCQLICLQSLKAPQTWQFPPSCVLLLKVSYVHSRKGSHPSTSQTVKGQSQQQTAPFYEVKKAHCCTRHNSYFGGLLRIYPLTHPKGCDSPSPSSSTTLPPTNLYHEHELQQLWNT